jgi:Spy/CpxP family protein refolding chaperone
MLARLVALAALLALPAAPAAGQSHGAHAPAPPSADAHRHGAGGSPQGHLEALRCQESFDQVVGEGLGFGLAFAADRNGYPGPVHVVELAHQLGLQHAQVERARALVEAMFAESRPKSAALLAAEADLAGLFERGEATEARVRERVAEVERLRAELRLVHLAYHLRARGLLTPEQRAAYHRARWSAAR